MIPEMKRYTIPERRETRKEQSDDEEGGFIPDKEMPRILQRNEENPKAQGRIDVGIAEYTDTLQRYSQRIPQQILDEDRPPFAWTATPDEIAIIQKWINTRHFDLERVRNDNTRKFLEVFAAHLKQQVNSLKLGTFIQKGGAQREMNEALRWIQAGKDVLERPPIQPGLQPGQTPAVTPPPSAPSTPPRTAVLQRPSLIGAVQIQQAVTGEEVGLTVEEIRRVLTEEGPRGLLQQTPKGLSHMNERLRLAAIAEWMDRPDLIGLQGLRSEVYGHCEAAYVNLKMRMKQYRNVPDMNIFIDSDITEVRNLFARFAATMALITDFFAAPVTALDRNKLRLDQLLLQYAQMLNQWEYHEREQTFRRKSEEDMETEYNSLMKLPPVRRRF